MWSLSSSYIFWRPISSLCPLRRAKPHSLTERAPFDGFLKPQSHDSGSAGVHALLDTVVTISSRHLVNTTGCFEMGKLFIIPQKGQQIVVHGNEVGAIDEKTKLPLDAAGPPSGKTEPVTYPRDAPVEVVVSQDKFDPPIIFSTRIAAGPRIPGATRSFETLEALIGQVKSKAWTGRTTHAELKNDGLLDIKDLSEVVKGLPDDASVFLTFKDN